MKFWPLSSLGLGSLLAAEFRKASNHSKPEPRPAARGELALTQTEALPLLHQPHPAFSLESLWVMLKIELNKQKALNLGCSHRQTLILTLWESWLHDQGHWCPVPANTTVHIIKPQHTTADEGVISPDTTTAFRSSINTVKLVWNHSILVLHLIKAAGWRALEDALVAPEPLHCFL